MGIGEEAGNGGPVAASQGMGRLARFLVADCQQSFGAQTESDYGVQFRRIDVGYSSVSSNERCRSRLQSGARCEVCGSDKADAREIWR